MIDPKTVSYIAELSRLHITETEAAKFARDLEAIIGYARNLEALDIKDIPPTSHVLNVENVFRDDIVMPSLPQHETMGIAIEKLDGSFKVPKVIE